jgi:hypothetical protein
VYYQHQQQKYYNFIIKEEVKQIRKITVRFSPDSMVGVTNKLWAGWIAIGILAEARDFIF